MSAATPFALDPHHAARSIDRRPVTVVGLGPLLEDLQRDVQLANGAQRTREARRQLPHFPLGAAGGAGPGDGSASRSRLEATRARCNAAASPAMAPGSASIRARARRCSSVTDGLAAFMLGLANRKAVRGRVTACYTSGSLRDRAPKPTV